jgi:lipopolysaccharide transport system ATP-binding protein
MRNENKNFEDALVENDKIELITTINFNTQDAKRYHLTYHLYNDMGECYFHFQVVACLNLRRGENNIY